ncbi:hypothetical protein CALCODRAFT_512908 [Calocera cornea HHB12733]|uniref:Uncharacterized protein n=1 Tax=Calocera cornea HHB12733 TaxID=1353952 RepID=A0A165CN63_9BASI|nr:hypothetical protein CALCODRAFT_512908 [Calocera cornea HHB12733]
MSATPAPAPAPAGPIPSQPKPRRLPAQPPSNPVLAAALAAKSSSTPTAAAAVSGSPAAPSTGTPTAVGSVPAVPASSTPAAGQGGPMSVHAQATPADPNSTPAAPADTAISLPESAPTVQTVTDHPTAESGLALALSGPGAGHGEGERGRKVYLEEEVERLGLAFKTTVIRAGDIMRFQNHVRRLNVTQYVPRVPYALSSSLAREVERFDEACDQIEAALLTAYGAIYAELERRKEAERAALSPPPPHVPSRAATTPPSALAGPSSLLPSQPASPRPTTAHERPHPPPLNTRLTELYPQRPSAFPRPSAVHLSDLPNATLSLTSLPSSSTASEAYPAPPPSRHLNHPGLSLDLSATKLFGVRPDSLASPVTLAPKRGGQQSPTSEAAGLLPPELLSALQGDLSALQNLQNLPGMQGLQNLQALQGLQMSPSSIPMQLQMSPHQQQNMQLLPEGLGLMSPAHIDQQGDMDMDYLNAPSGGGTRPGTSAGASQPGAEGGVQGGAPGGMDGMDIDFLDIPGQGQGPAAGGDGTQAAGVGSRPATAGAQPEGEKKQGANGDGDQAMGDMLVSLGSAGQGDGSQQAAPGGASDSVNAAHPASEQGTAPASGAQGETNLGDMSGLGGMDFNIPGLDDPDFLNTFTKPSSPSALSGLDNLGTGEDMDFGPFDLGELPELGFGGGGETGDGGLDFSSMGHMDDLGGLGGMGDMGGMSADGSGMGDLDFGSMGDMGMDMDFGSLGDMLGSAGEQAGAGQAEGAAKPVPAARTGKGGDSSAMDDDGMIDLDGGLDLDELFKNFGGEEGEEPLRQEPAAAATHTSLSGLRSWFSNLLGS